MKTYTSEELQTILQMHKDWLDGKAGGRGADLSGAYLSGADLRGADLRRADLRRAYLGGADLRRASLGRADLSGAYLGGADLSGAIGIYAPMACPTEGSFIGWKKARLDIEGTQMIIVKLQIPKDAKRSSATTNKCRCNKAKVLAFYDLDGNEIPTNSAYSDWDTDFVYTKGKTVKVDDFDENRWCECSAGIHFFINRGEAERY